MGQRIAMDFGTTNSVLARWNETLRQPELVSLPPYSRPAEVDACPLIPTLVYVEDGREGRLALGHEVVAHEFHRQRDNRLFRNFKRGILSNANSEPRWIDGMPWNDRDAGRSFLSRLLQALPFGADEIEQFVLTVPVAAFEGYVGWLSEEVQSGALNPETLRIVDESTAAALGYSVTEPGALVLVFDFGGGSLDLSLVQLPESREKTGGWLAHLRGKSTRASARVIGKAGVTLGGSDIDHWMLADILQRSGLALEQLGADYPRLLTACEAAKIELSDQVMTEVKFEAGDQEHSATVERADLERLLTENGFYAGIQQVIDKVMHVARRQGIYKEDIHHILLVGGTSLIPSVQACVSNYFGGRPPKVDKPFTAVVEGALQLAAGFGLEDYLTHSYGLRYWDPQTGTHQYDEIVAAGSRYPSTKPVEVLLGAAHPGQEQLEFVIAEIDTEAVAAVEVKYEDGQAVFVAQARPDQQQVRPLNRPGGALTVALDPPGTPGKDRLRGSFYVDEKRQLRLDVTDLLTNRQILQGGVVASLTEGGAGLREANLRQGLLYTPESDPNTQWGAEAVQHSPGQDMVGTPAGSGPDAAETPREPALNQALSGVHQWRLSLRNLGAMMNLIPPEAISLEAAEAALFSKEFYVRFQAADLLARRGDREARRVMQNVLNQGGSPQRASVAYHLFRFSWFTAEPLLRQALADPDLRVRESAVYALCLLADTHAYTLLTSTLAQEGDAIKAAAVWGMSRHPDRQCLPALEIALQASDPEVRVQALEVIGAINERQATPLVRRYLRDPDLDVRYAAVLSWIELEGEAAFGDLAGMILETQGADRQALLRGFFHASNYLFIPLGTCQAVDQVLVALEAGLQDEAHETRLAAALPLAWMRHPRAVALLRQEYAVERQTEMKIRLLYCAVHLMSPVGGELLAAALASDEPDLVTSAEYIRREWREHLPQ